MGFASLLTTAACAALTVVSSSSCSPARYRSSADAEVYRLIDERRGSVPDMPAGFDIETPDPPDLAHLPHSRPTTEDAAFLGEELAETEDGAATVSLDDALALSVEHGRRYLTRRELVYLDGLTLSLQQHRLTPIFTAGGGGRYNRSVTPSSTAIGELVRDNTFTASAGAGVSVLARTGARLAADLTGDFLSFVGGPDSDRNSSRLAASLVQPLLQGAGSLNTLEPLTRADRNLLYEIRDFSRFRKEFAVDIATEYYQVLAARDGVRNAFINYQGLGLTLEREEALGEEDLRTQTELGQLRQAELSAELKWINAIRSYAGALDTFKISLGIPVTEKIVLSETDLTELQLFPPEISREEAIHLALVTRLDLHTIRDQVDDSERSVHIAARDLQPGLDVVATADAGSETGNGLQTIDFDRRNWSVGLDLDLPIDRKAERNNYRAALIDQQRSIRELELAEDQARLDVISRWRDLGQAAKQYEIAQLGVALASRRLEEQELLMELGRGTVRDLVDARSDLIESQDQRTEALVDHTSARLRFWRDIGILFIKPDGSWERKFRNHG